MESALTWILAGGAAYAAGLSTSWTGQLCCFGIASIVVYAHILQVAWRKRVAIRLKRERRLRRAILAPAERRLKSRKELRKILGHVPEWYANVGNVDKTVESVEWLNEVLRKLWPSLVPQLDKILCASLNPALEANLPKTFSALYFDSIRFGLRQTPKIDRVSVPKGLGKAVVKVRGGSSRRRRVVKESRFAVDMRVKFSANQKDDALLRMTVKTLLLAVPIFLDNVSFEGSVRVEMRSVGGDLPCFHAVAVSFLGQPRINFDILPGTGFDVAHIPFLHDAISSMMREQIETVVVSPNCVRLSLSELLPEMFG